MEHVDIWGRYYGEDVTAKQAIASIVMQVAVFYGVVNVAIMYVGEGCMFQWAEFRMAAGSVLTIAANWPHAYPPDCPLRKTDRPHTHEIMFSLIRRIEDC